MRQKKTKALQNTALVLRGKPPELYLRRRSTPEEATLRRMYAKGIMRGDQRFSDDYFDNGKKN